MSDLARALLEELADDPAAIERLRELVGNSPTGPPADSRAAAFTAATLAAELGRSERSIRAAIARGELEAVKRGRGYVIGADAVVAWTQSEGRSISPHPDSSRPRRRRSGPGPMRRALEREQT